MSLIAFTGPSGAGKSTAAERLTMVHGYTLVRFADPLKRMMLALGLSENDVYSGDREAAHPYLCGKSTRFAMQTLGTEWGRDMIGENLWVFLWWKASLAVIRDGGKIVVDDVRFPNEVEAVTSGGGVIVPLFGRAGVVAPHASEDLVVAVEDGPAIDNSGQIADLHYQVDNLVERIEAPEPEAE